MKFTLTEGSHTSTYDNHIQHTIEQALAQDEFIVMYQPKFNTHTMQTIGAEALVRWQLPNGKIVPPNNFIPYFEKHGFICRLDFYVLEKVCQMLVRTMDQGFAPLPVSVNFSRLHIHAPDFAQQLHSVVASYGLSADLIEIEFTESAFVDDVPPLDSLIAQLHNFGYKVAMDDFGTGFSSLNDLMNLKVDILKLDRAFLRFTGGNEHRARCIIQAVVQMAHALGISVVAEGVEDCDGLEFLKECGCETAQGYYYSKPIAEDSYLRFLQPCTIAV